jgi:hypothetical protein
MCNSEKYKEIKDSIFIIYQNYKNGCANFSKRNIEVQIENILLRKIGIIFCKEIIGAN